MGKYTCLLCQKEFSSESGVKYHICKTHSQVRHKTYIKTWSYTHTHIHEHTLLYTYSNYCPHKHTHAHLLNTHTCHKTSAPVSAALTSSFHTPCCPFISIQNWFRATDPVSNSKNKDSQSNELEKDMKNVPGVPWRKRGRKPRERLAETASTREKTLNISNGPSMNHQTPNPNTILTPIQTSSENPVCATLNSIPTPIDGISLTYNRDLQPPVKKQPKPKKARLTE